MHLVSSFLFFLLRPWFAFLGLGEHIDAESRIPSQLAVGEYATAAWVIHKGDARGFARLNLGIPHHLEVTPLDTHGASFEITENSVKLIWLDAPEEPSFQIKLGMRAKPQFEGGAFEPLWSYIVDGQRQDVAMTPAYMAAAAAEMAGSPLLPAPTDWEVHGAEPESVDAVNRDYDPNGFTIARQVHIEGPEIARVEFHLSGHPKNRMLRIYETMPEGCRAEHDVLERATVRFESQELIYSWFNAPKAERFKVSYRIMGDLNACLTSLSGHVEFAVGETTQVVNIPDCPSHQLFDPEGWLQNELALTTETRGDEPLVSDAVNVPAPDAGVSFRVQVLAAHTHVKSPWFKQKFGFLDPIDAEPHESWIKYTTGSFANYASARNRREELAASYAFPGPFVTAYEEGERITVQEALVLAQQEWIP
jgi:hypothetical protein